MTSLSRIHPDWIRAYMDFAGFSEAPDKMHFWAAVGTIAGALRRRVWIDQAYFHWVPNFYIIFVAPPGIVSKSSTADIGMSMLREIGGINFGPSAVTWQSLVQTMATSTEAFPLPDGTFMPMSAITCVASEFGTFLNPSDREMVDVLVSLWDGQKGAFTKGTKTQGNDTIQNPWINIMACTTPAWMSNNLPDYMIYGGFCSRCIFVYADKKKHLVAYPRNSVPEDFSEKRDALVRDLEVISMMVGEMSLSKEATARGIKWYNDHYTIRPKMLDNEKFGGYLARKQTHIHKLAMVLAASRSNSLIVTLPDLEFAIDMITALESTMPQIYGGIGASPGSRFVRRILEIVDAHGPIALAGIYQKCFREMGYDELTLAVKGAVQTGFIRQLPNPSTDQSQGPLYETNQNAKSAHQAAG